MRIIQIWLRPHDFAVRKTACGKFIKPVSKKSVDIEMNCAPYTHLVVWNMSPFQKPIKGGSHTGTNPDDRCEDSSSQLITFVFWYSQLWHEDMYSSFIQLFNNLIKSSWAISHVKLVERNLCLGNHPGPHYQGSDVIEYLEWPLYTCPQLLLMAGWCQTLAMSGALIFHWYFTELFNHVNCQGALWYSKYSLPIFHEASENEFHNYGSNICLGWILNHPSTYKFQWLL
jgi:hypothetical protein